MADLLTRAREATACGQCRCVSCGRGGSGEAHDHACTSGPKCIDTPERMRGELRRYRDLIRDLADAVTDHDRRTSELLAANNREVERRRTAERELRELRAAVLRFLQATGGCKQVVQGIGGQTIDACLQRTVVHVPLLAIDALVEAIEEGR